MTFFPRPEQQKKKKMFENKTPHYSFIIKHLFLRVVAKILFLLVLQTLRKRTREKKIPGGIN